MAYLPAKGLIPIGLMKHLCEKQMKVAGLTPLRQEIRLILFVPNSVSKQLTFREHKGQIQTLNRYDFILRNSIYIFLINF